MRRRGDDYTRAIAGDNARGDKFRVVVEHRCISYRLMFYDRGRTNARSTSRFGLSAKWPFVFVDFWLWRRNQLINRVVLLVMIQQAIGHSICEIFS